MSNRDLTADNDKAVTIHSESITVHDYAAQPRSAEKKQAIHNI